MHVRQSAADTFGFPPRIGTIIVTTRLVRSGHLTMITLEEDIVRILRETGLDPRHLELEITEGAVMPDPDAACATLARLREIGISLAIDDFGTGCSSLDHLKRFPVNVLKIDPSFVRGLGQHDQDSAIVRGVIALAPSLALSVTAEGIETFEQLARLRELGCDHGHGYLRARRLQVEAFDGLLDRSVPMLASPKYEMLVDHRRAASQERSGATVV